MNYLGEEKLEATEGKKSKASFIQMVSLIYVLGYKAFYIYVDRHLAISGVAQNIIFGILTFVGVILLVITAFHNRKRKDAAFCWSILAVTILLFFSTTYRYLIGWYS